MPRNFWIGLATLIIIVGAIAALRYVQTQQSVDENDKQTSSITITPEPTSQVLSEEDTNEEGGTMQSEDIVVGTGDEAVAGKTVTVNYVGTLTDGTNFDASADHGQPFTFMLGAGNVIKGWDTGVVGMKVGGKRKLTIPPELAYGDQQAGSIPPNSTLVFEIELLKVE